MEAEDGRVGELMVFSRQNIDGVGGAKVTPEVEGTKGVEVEEGVV